VDLAAVDAAVRDYRRALSGIDAAKLAAKRRVEAARGRADAARVVLHAAMVDAAQDGVRPVELQQRTGYTKERVRQILRAGGVDPDWPSSYSVRAGRRVTGFQPVT